jgi:hypothetical protein
MNSLLFRVCTSIGLAFVLGGCTSSSVQMEHGRSLKKIQRFFVVSNLNDNHGIDHRIAEVLKARGREADSGPLTMMPDNTQVIVTYNDHWNWDFSDHLTFLQMSVRDTKSEQSFATVTFSAKIPSRKDPLDIVTNLVDELLDKN